MKLRTDSEHEEEILQTLALTAKIQKKLKNLVSRNQSLHGSQSRSKTVFEEQEQLQTLRAEISKLRQQNEELYRDNEQLCQKIVKLEKSKKAAKQQLVEHKQYIKYLQSTCEELKKEILIWMYKPSKKEQQSINSQRGDQLVEKVKRLKLQNQKKAQELSSLQQSSKIPFESKERQYRSQSVIDEKEAFRESRRKMHPKNQCTSCNYLSASKKSKKRPVTACKEDRTTYTKKNLCECHRKYVKNNVFKH